jgi:hypothetical protein
MNTSSLTNNFNISYGVGYNGKVFKITFNKNGTLNVKITHSHGSPIVSYIGTT